MGIPFYFKSLINRYPEIIGTGARKCNALYLDYNCIIHNSAYKVSKSLNLSQKDFYSKVIADSLAYIDVLIDTCPPSDLLFIAVDGTCPRAKMQQQRKRRFMSHWRQTKISEMQSFSVQNPSLFSWDSNCVTPGTEFMNEFDARLHAYVDELRQRYPFQVVVSGSGEFGEGEHKIFMDLDTKTSHNTDVNVIYGLDADLIMLSIIQKKTSGNILLLRERPEFNVPIKQQAATGFLILDIPQLKNGLVRDYLSHDESRVNDYVLLCTLIGNDFIPPLSFLKIKSDGIEVLLNIYNRVASLGNHSRLIVIDDTGASSLNEVLLGTILQEIAGIEDKCMLDADESYYSKKCYFDAKNCSYESKIDSYPITHKFPRTMIISQPHWRMDYYKYLFNYPNKDIVQKSCEKFMEGIMWIYQYYFTRSHNCGWHYPFQYSPTALDLSNYLMGTTNKSYDIVTTSHSTHVEFMDMIKKPGFHLLMVLPPTSRDLVPGHLRPILSEVRYGCVQYFPYIFNITTYLKTYLWECSAILPEIDIQRLSSAYDEAIASSIE